MEHRREKILKALPEPSSHLHLLLLSFHKSESENSKPRNEAMCLKCLTPWTAGQFTMKINPSNHKRKRRRQFQIDRLQKEIKASDKKSATVKLQRQLQHLQEQNNHIAIYKCRLCKGSTSVQLWKPKSKLSNQDVNKIVTVVGNEKEADGSSDKTKDKTNNPKKKKGKKKKNTAGLIIPAKRSQEQTQAVANNRLSMAKLSNMLQQSTAQSPMSKLNQFLK